MQKVFLWGIYLVFVAVLIFGAVNRTTAKSEGPEREQPLTAGDRNNEEIYSGFGERNGSGRERANLESDAGEQVGETKSNHNLTGEYAAGEEDHDWLELKGVVVQVDDIAIVVETGNEEFVEISRRAYRFAAELGYSPRVGDEIVLAGFFEGNEFEVGSIMEELSEQVWVLRDKTGRPLWAGSGN